MFCFRLIKLTLIRSENEFCILKKFWWASLYIREYLPGSLTNEHLQIKSPTTYKPEQTPLQSWQCLVPSLSIRKVPNVRGCLHDTGATFMPKWVHSGSLSWLYICLHDTTTKCHASASHPSVSSPQLLYRGENFTPVWNLAMVSCKRETTTLLGAKSVCW